MPGPSNLNTFRLFAFRFTFEVLDPVFFAPGAAGNAFRGAFWSHLPADCLCSGMSGRSSL